MGPKMTKPNQPADKSPLVFGLVVGGFVWLVFDSVGLGIVAGFATFFLVKRDQQEDIEEE